MFTIFDNITECIIIINKNNQIEYVNTAFERVFGYNPHELLNKSLSLVISEEFLSECEYFKKKSSKKSFGRKIDQQENICAKHKNGQTFPIKISLSYTKVESQTFIIAIILDMTKQKKLIDELKLSKFLYSSLLEQATDHIFQIDIDMNVQYINHLHTGLNKDKIINSNLLNLFSNEKNKYLVKSTINKVFKTGSPQNYEIECSSPLGLLYYSTIVSPLIKDGQIVGANLISRNLTEHINMKNNLLEQQKFIDKTNVYSLNGIYIYNLSTGKNSFINESYQKILGYSLNDLNSMNPTEFFACFHPDNQNIIAEHMNIIANLEEGQSAEIEYRFKAKSGEWKWCKSIDSGFEYHEGKLVSFIGSFIDITEQKKIEQDLINKNKEIQNFAHIVSHDLKTPLHNIMLGLEYLTDDNDDRELLKKNIISSASHMNDMINSLLLNAKIDKTHEWEKFDTCQILEELKQDLSSTIKENNAKIIYNNLPVIKGVSTLFRMLLQNLIINSLKYKDSLRTPKINIQCESKATHWIFIFQDNGSGICENDLNKIFNMFERSSKHQKIEGSGIGLANCQKIVNLHNGNIWVESKEEEGATFFFTIAKE